MSCATRCRFEPVLSAGNEVIGYQCPACHTVHGRCDICKQRTDDPRGHCLKDCPTCSREIPKTEAACEMCRLVTLTCAECQVEFEAPARSQRIGRRYCVAKCRRRAARKRKAERRKVLREARA